MVDQYNSGELATRRDLRPSWLTELGCARDRKGGTAATVITVDGERQPLSTAHRATGRRRGRPGGAGANGAATRERVVAAAIELFSTQGFHATGVAELARAADLGAGAL